MPDSQTPTKKPFRSLPLAQREVALLIILCLIAVATFAGTRRLASWSRARRALAAAGWFSRGAALVTAGDTMGGIADLREAVAADRQNHAYVLALARALADAGRRDEARQLLLQLRQSQPDDVEVNYRLARLAVLEEDTAEAVRYYNLAMYGLKRVGADFDRRTIRIELIGFLLDRAERQEARAELEALDRELPDDPAVQLQAARLADRAGDPRRAFQHYRKASQLDPRRADAAAGAGEAAFSLRDFAEAATELTRAIALGGGVPAVQEHLQLARLVLTSDPLASKIGTRERARRVEAGLSRAADRQDSCLGVTKAAAAPTDPTRAELEELRRHPPSELGDPDVAARAVALISAVEATVRARCPGVSGLIDQAWTLVAAAHSGGTS